MADVWLIIEVEDSILKDKPLNGKRLHYIVSPTLGLTLEERDVDDVLASASDKGFEIQHASDSYPGVAPWVWKRVEEKVLAALREKLETNVRSFAVSITPLNVLKKY